MNKIQMVQLKVQNCKIHGNTPTKKKEKRTYETMVNLKVEYRRLWKTGTICKYGVYCIY